MRKSGPAHTSRGAFDPRIVLEVVDAELARIDCVENGVVWLLALHTKIARKPQGDAAEVPVPCAKFAIKLTGGGSEIEFDDAIELTFQRTSRCDRESSSTQSFVRLDRFQRDSRLTPRQETHQQWCY